jgi:hypothetical protein
MINFVLFHNGPHFPVHVKSCIENIVRFNPNSKIYFITNHNVKFENSVEVLNLNDFKSKQVLTSSFFNESPDRILFRNSLFRFLFINEFIKNKQLTNVVHFDNDIMVYEDFSKFVDIFEKSNISITPHSANEYVCGFMYIKNNIDAIEDLFLRIVNLDRNSLYNLAGANFMPNEMRLLYLLNKEKHCMTMLPVLPFGEFSNNFEKFNSVFDPSSYGQHIGGTPDNITPGWVAPKNLHRAIDPYLHSKEINIIFENKLPYIEYNDKLIKLNNLHIHSKQTYKFTA